MDKCTEPITYLWIFPTYLSAVMCAIPVVRIAVSYYIKGTM